MNDPVRYSFNALRANSKRRGIPFSLTLEQFTEFCRETDYLAGKGRQLTSYTIDRKNPDKGYTYENIQVLTLSDNARKGKKYLKYDWATKEAVVVEDLHEEDAGPF